MSVIRHKLLAAGVKNLKDFGYPNVTMENILTDQVYSAFFKSMLEDNLGQMAAADPVIKQLLSELQP